MSFGMTQPPLTPAQLHERFAEHRVRGEWFRLVPEIVAYINSLPAQRKAAS